jgi:uncharacterized protein
MKEGENLLLFGASTRAAAFSALRAGLRPWCADLFADSDLRARCPVAAVPAERYPDGFLDLLPGAPPGPWMYTGALENRRGLVRKLARLRPLWGNDAAALAAARSPWRVHSALTAAGLPCPAVRPVTDPPRGRGRWLLKPRAGATGCGIRFWDGSAVSRSRAAKSYLQEFIEGENCAALYVGDGTGARLLGVTQQLVGESWLGAGRFRYCGSVGPFHLGPSTRALLEKIGETLTAAAGLRGLFGVDFVLRDGVPWPVEVNPRYTASVEVLEYAIGLPALPWHCRVFEAAAPVSEQVVPGSASIVGKAILFARASLDFPAEGPWLPELRSPGLIEEMPAFADIPPAGQRIEAGKPILTCFAGAADVDGCLERLRRVARDINAVLFGARPPPALG